MDAQRTDEDLRRFADEHLIYEIEMLFGTADRLTGRTPVDADIITQNALLESFTIHARALLSFFTETVRSKPDDALAVDFIPSWTPPTELDESLPELRRRVGKEIAHLTYARNAVEPEDKGWAVDWIARELLTFVNDFVSEAPFLAVSNEFRKRALNAESPLLGLK